jgi:putative nucleotidyltransferase with HDIG domain
VISHDIARRLAAFIDERRQYIVAATVRSSILPRPNSLAANRFAFAFLEGLRRELEAGESQTLDAWGAVEIDPEDAFEHARIVVIACDILASRFAEETGERDDVGAYLARRSRELEARFRTDHAAKVAQAMDPEKVLSRPEAVATLLAAIELRHAPTFEHCRAVGMWCGRIAKTLQLGNDVEAAATIAGTLHDVGKIATPPEILDKPGALTPAEWEPMRAHARLGARMLERIPALADLAPIVGAHHERVDGAGYPGRLRGSDIPIVARIVAVADAFNAMIGKRPYRDALAVPYALEELLRGAGTQWDADVVQALFDIVRPATVRRTLRSAEGGASA